MFIHNNKNLFALSLVLGLLCCFVLLSQVQAQSESPLNLGSIPEDARPNEGEIGFRVVEGGFLGWLEDTVGRVAGYFFMLGMVIAPLVILVGAFMFLTSGGDTTRVAKGKAIVIWAAIGLAILLSARIIMSIVKMIFDF